MFKGYPKEMGTPGDFEMPRAKEPGNVKNLRAKHVGNVSLPKPKVRALKK